VANSQCETVQGLPSSVALWSSIDEPRRKSSLSNRFASAAPGMLRRVDAFRWQRSRNELSTKASRPDAIITLQCKVSDQESDRSQQISHLLGDVLLGSDDRVICDPHRAWRHPIASAPFLHFLHLCQRARDDICHSMLTARPEKMKRW
jgi:hypothetical protein